MRKLKILSLTLALLCLLTGCSDQRKQQQAEVQKWMNEREKLKILSTTAMIDDLVKQVGNGHVAAITLIQGELDPHSYQLVKGDDEKLSRADIIFYNGVGLEHGPSLHHYLTSHKAAVGVGDHIDQSLVLSVQGQKDPHIWMDISLWARTLPVIVKTLSEKDPAHAADYSANAEKLHKQMIEVHEKVKKMMHEVPEKRRYLVTSHDAFSYFSRAYLAEDHEIADGSWRKRFAAPEGLAPESQLSTNDIIFIISHVKKYHVPVIFPETNVSRDSLEKIIQAAKEEGVSVKMAACCPLYGDAMGPPGSEGDSYLKMIENDAFKISSHMKEGS